MSDLDWENLELAVKLFSSERKIVSLKNQNLHVSVHFGLWMWRVFKKTKQENKFVDLYQNKRTSGRNKLLQVSYLLDSYL